MLTCLDSLRQLTLPSILFRLLLAMLCGGVIGMEREQKRSPAGFRTYMLVCIGAALTILLGEYEVLHLAGPWRTLIESQNNSIDVARYGAQVISGVGFLGAGTIVINRSQEVRGLTTAAGLWASACMGLAIGAAFYECVILGFLLIFIVNRYFSAITARVVEQSPYMNIYLRFDSVENIRTVLTLIRERGIRIFELDLDKPRQEQQHSHGVVLLLYVGHGIRHADVISTISTLDCIQEIEEI